MTDKGKKGGRGKIPIFEYLQDKESVFGKIKSIFHNFFGEVCKNGGHELQIEDNV